jgi:PAS domain S-box-containing protein
MRKRRVYSALRVALIYALIGVVYIPVSDYLLTILVTDQQEMVALQTVKDWGFVFWSAILLFFLLQRELKKLQIAEAKQEESERALSTLLGNLPGMAFRRPKSASWAMEFVSQGCEELTGYRATSIINDDKAAYGDLIHPDDRGPAEESIRTALAEERPYQIIYRISTRKGEEKWVWEQGRAVPARQAEEPSLEGFITDITERVNAEKEIERRVQQQVALNAIIAASTGATELSALLSDVLKHCLRGFNLEHGMIWVLDYKEMSGISNGEGQQLLAWHQSMGTAEKSTNAVSDWREVEDRDQDISCKRMLEFGFRASLMVPILAEGRVIGGVCLLDEGVRRWTMEEIELGEAIGRQLGGAAERLSLLETIQAQAHLLQRILDTVREGIFTLDPDKRILVTNPSARVDLKLIANAEPGDVLTRLGDRPLEELFIPREDGLPHEIEVHGKAGRVFEIYPNPIEVGSEKAGWTILLRDVTEVRQVQRRVQEQISRGAVGQLAAGIAHDFNNIAAAIILYSEMVLGMQNLPAKAHERMKTILDQAHRAASLTRQILDFSRRGLLEPHAMDLVPFMKEMVRLLEQTVPENIRVRFRYGNGAYVVNTDPARIQQVFMNLALNARDAMPSGGELIFDLSSIEIHEGDPPLVHDMLPGKWIRIGITDTGVGITEENFPHLFEPFFTTKPPGEGTGLGLAQVFGIVKQHEGHIDVKSQLGVGTTFEIYLPELPISALSGIISEDVSTLKGRKETILVVEDDEAMREALVEMLELMDYHVFSAKDGRDALQCFEKERGIHLVLSDLVMPEMGGVALYETLKEHYPSVKMVMMTGYPLAERGKDLIEKGIVAWIQKPLDADTLARTIKKVIGGTK